MYFSLLYLSININELLYKLVPIKIPFSSKIEEDINGYVAVSPDVKTFLFDTACTSALFSNNGSVDNKVCSSLKYALLLCIPLPCNMLSTLLIEYSNSLILSEKTAI